MAEINSKIPQGPLADKWKNYKDHQKLVNPANKRRLDIIVVGTGLAGASAAASLAEMGFNVLNFCIQDSPRRAHSIAAQGGINAAKNYQNDGDSVYRLFYDTIKGGDYRAREANVYRLAEVSNNIIDQCVAQGVPFAREYGGLLDNRSFGGAQVSRTFYARGQTGQQLLLGAYSALSRQIGKGKVKMYTRHEMLDVVLVDGRARGIITRNLITGKIERYAAHAVVVATGGYVNTFFLSTNAMASNGSAAWHLPDLNEYPSICPPYVKPEMAGTWTPFQRDPKTGVRYWAIPGTEGFMHRIGGLEKSNETGAISTDPENHHRMVQLRAEKVARIADSLPDLQVEGDLDADLLIVGFGGTYGHLHSAMDTLRKQGKKAALAHFRFINPLPRNTEAVLRRYPKIVVAEQNMGQLAGYLRMKIEGIHLYQFNQVKGQPFVVQELVDAFTKILEE